MDNMKLLRYAYDSAIDKWWRYDKIATQYAGRRAEILARKMANEAKADVNAIAEMIHAEEAKQRLNANVLTELRNLIEKIVVKEQAEQQSSKAPQPPKAQKQEQTKAPQAPYVIVIKWETLGEIEYPCQNLKEAESNFELAKREVHGGRATEAHVYDQTDGERYPVMGIMSGKL